MRLGHRHIVLYMFLAHSLTHSINSPLHLLTYINALLCHPVFVCVSERVWNFSLDYAFLRHRSSVFCAFLDASKAFDRVHYCKLLRLLIKRGIPACFIRNLVYMYFGHSVRLLWAGISSTYFQALNDVKQGGVISPVLFCINRRSFSYDALWTSEIDVFTFIHSNRLNSPRTRSA